MGVRGNGDPDPLIPGLSTMDIRQIQPLWIGIQFQDLRIGPAGIHDPVHVHLIGFPLSNDPARKKRFLRNGSKWEKSKRKYNFQLDIQKIIQYVNIPQYKKWVFHE